MTSRNRRKPWSGPVDMNQINTESITILQYWDIYTPTPKGAKLSKFRSKRHRRISLEMHRMPREDHHGGGGSQSLELDDVFDDNESSVASNRLTYNRAYFRISKFVPMKSSSNAEGEDNSLLGIEKVGGSDDASSVISDVSARTKDFFSKPDHEWRTKFLLRVSRVAITEIKNEKEVFFEAWDNGQVIERSLIFRTADQAKEFAYDLERLANEDPDINEDGGGTFIAPQNMVINTVSSREDPKEEESLEQIQPREQGNSSIINHGTGSEMIQSIPPGSSQARNCSQVNHQDMESGRSILGSMVQEPSYSSNTADRKGICHSLTFFLTDMLHLLGMVMSLSAFLYAVAIFSYKPDPLYNVGIMILSWSSLIAAIHGSGMLGIHEICCCGKACWINLSMVFGIVSVHLHGALIVVIEVRKDYITHYLMSFHEKLYLTEDIIAEFDSHLLKVVIIMIIWCLLDILRICFLLKLKRNVSSSPSHVLSESEALMTPLLGASQV